MNGRRWSAAQFAGVSWVYEDQIKQDVMAGHVM
jgi:hypothetical protein